MSYYNLTECMNVESLTDFLNCPNSLSNGGFWMFIWVSVFFVTFIITKNMRLQTQESFAGASVLGFFFAVFLWWLQLIGWQLMLGSLILMILAGVWVLVSNQREVS